ncbi:hypothetical protein AKJ16_DCAP03273 [Drosera capensis]
MCESITTFIKESVDNELKEDGSSSGVKPQNKKLTFCVEGNISVGKTTFLQRIANETLELRDLVEVVPEPVFVKAVHEAKWMSEMEISIYDLWFDPMVSALPGGVSLDYLRDLHEKHESWLFPSQSGNHGVLSVSKLPLSLDSSLEGPNMHPSFQKVPVLVLDCETNIDLDRDVEAKQHYARQVAEFFSFVKRAKEVISPNEQNVTSSQQQVVLPQNPGLWVPSQMQFPDPASKSFDRRAVSYFSG